MQSGRTFLKPQILIPAALLLGAAFWVGIRAREARPGQVNAALAAKSVPVVIVTQPTRRLAVRSITLPATVEAFEKATLYAKVSGYLESIQVDRGDRVRQGQALAHIAVPEMVNEYAEAKNSIQEAQASYERAQANARLKTLTFQRVAGVRKSQPEVISEQEVDQARAEAEVAEGEVRLAKARLEVARSRKDRLQTLLEYATIRAPYDGIITDRFVDPGAMIQVATSSTNVAPVVSIANMDRVRIYISVPEPDVALVARGKPVEIRLDALPGKVYRYTVTRFSTAIDPSTRTMKTEIDLPNRDHLIKPGMFGSATVELARETNAVFVPVEALRKDAAGKSFVFTVGQGRLQKAPVEAGADDGRSIRVIGLRGDEQVVLSSTEALQEGLAVTTAKSQP